MVCTVGMEHAGVTILIYFQLLDHLHFCSVVLGRILCCSLRRGSIRRVPFAHVGLQSTQHGLPERYTKINETHQEFHTRIRSSQMLYSLMQITCSLHQRSNQIPKSIVGPKPLLPLAMLQVQGQTKLKNRYNRTFRAIMCNLIT